MQLQLKACKLGINRLSLKQMLQCLHLARNMRWINSVKIPGSLGQQVCDAKLDLEPMALANLALLAIAVIVSTSLRCAQLRQGTWQAEHAPSHLDVVVGVALLTRQL